MGVLDVSELGQPRATQRCEKRQLDDEQILRERIVSLASQYGRYGYRRVTAMLRNEGWLVSSWENGFIEPFNGKMRDELIAGEIFYSLKEVEILN